MRLNCRLVSSSSLYMPGVARSILTSYILYPSADQELQVFSFLLHRLALTAGKLPDFDC